MENWSNLAILFMGKELPNQLEISGCDLGDYSILHALDSSRVKRGKISHTTTIIDNSKTDVQSLAELPNKLTSIKALEILPKTSISGDAKLYFFVYCLTCDALRNGKLRVVCSLCNQGSILFQHEPQEWSDVLVPDRIKSQCYAPGCVGNRARFFFKCIDEQHHQRSQAEALSIATHQQAVLPLNRLRRNNIHAFCLACMDNQVEVVLVFPSCDHVICLECFGDYCKTCVSERNLSWSESLGYTINCPIDCEQSSIETPHLKLMDAHFYSLYSRFSTEELVLKNGGLMCPYTECDQPFYPFVMPPNQCEVTECSKCRLLYCILCTHEGQYAPLACPFSSMIEQTNITIRADNPFTTNTTTSIAYLSNLIIKFSSLRKMANKVLGSSEEPSRWQETMSRLKIREISKPCPKCRAPTERNGGCMHMVCTRRKCNFNWCWICLTEWNSDCMASHWFG